MKIFVMLVLLSLTGSARAGEWVDPEQLFPNLCEKSVCEAVKTSWEFSCQGAIATLAEPGQYYAVPQPSSCYCPCQPWSYDWFYNESLKW